MVSCRLPCIWIPPIFIEIYDIVVKIIFGQQSILAKSSIKNNIILLLDTNQFYVKQQF